MTILFAVLAALSVGAIAGFFLCAILTCGKQADECQQCELRKMER